jgi:DNA-binding NarL/FixJ family response regulator
VDAVRHVAAGDGVVAPEVTRRLIAELAAPRDRDGTGERADRVSLPADLTPRERDVLAGLGSGLSNAELAAELMISEATAKTHVSRVLAKLGVTSRVQAAIAARDAGLA